MLHSRFFLLCFFSRVDSLYNEKQIMPERNIAIVCVIQPYGRFLDSQK